MISVLKAKQIILKNTKILLEERKSSAEALNCILAENICASQDWPPFCRSTMDGFAVRSKDIVKAALEGGVSLKIVDTSFAGFPAKKTLKENQAIRIMTGAIVPSGADCVVMQEDTKRDSQNVEIFRGVKRGSNLRLKGADSKKGDLIISKGSKITPGIIGLFASFGKEYVKVSKTPKVGILVTGDELVLSDRKPKAGQIRSANEHALCAQLREIGVESEFLGIARDNQKDLEKKIRKGLRKDILLISGGVSVGDRDIVQEVLKKVSAKILFWKVAIKPGKPLIFAKKNQCHIFGLPGNTVSGMVSLKKFVMPCISKMRGQKRELLKTAEAILDHNIKVEPRRQKLMRGIVSQKKNKLFVRLSAHQVSENIMSIAKANCFFKIEEGVASLKKGQVIIVEYL